MTASQYPDNCRLLRQTTPTDAAQTQAHHHGRHSPSQTLIQELKGALTQDLERTLFELVIRPIVSVFGLPPGHRLPASSYSDPLILPKHPYPLCTDFYYALLNNHPRRHRAVSPRAWLSRPPEWNL